MALDKIDINKPEDQFQLARMVEDCYNKTKPVVEGMSRIWEENILFYEGNQWIEYNKYSRQYDQITLKNDWIPRPTVNLISPGFQTIVSLFTKNKPTAQISGNGDDQEDVNAAKVAEAVLDAKWEIDNEQDNSIEDILIALNCGTVIRKDYLDPAAGPIIQIPDPNQEGGFKNQAVGDNKIKILSPYEVYWDLVDHSWYCEPAVKGLSWVKAAYGRKGNGFTGLCDQVKAQLNLNSQLNYRERLRASTGIGGTASEGAAIDTKNKCVVVEAYIIPCPKFPQGLMIVEAGGVPLYINPPPCFDERVDDSWNPYTMWKWQVAPLRDHGLSLGEQVVPLQRQINKIYAMIELYRLTMANPIWMFPKGCGVPEGFNPNRPGAKMWFNPVGANGAIPTRMSGAEIPMSVLKELEDKISKLHAIMRDNEVLSGNNPTGVKTAQGLNLLLEQSYSAFSMQITAREKFLEKSQQKKLLIIQKHFKESRPQLTQKIKELSNGKDDIKIQDFVGADLRDSVNVRIEAGSSLPRSKLAQQQQLLDLQEKGLLGDVSPANPVANAEFLERFGVQQFDGITNADVLKAKHNIRILNGINDGKFSHEMYPEFKPFEDSRMQMEILTAEMKKPDFKDPMGMFERKFQELSDIQATINGGMQEGIGGEEMQEEPQEFPSQGENPTAGNSSPLPSDGEYIGIQ